MNPDWRDRLELRQSVVPPLDRDFLPASSFHRAFRRLADSTGGPPLRFALERGGGTVSVYETRTLRPSVETADLVRFHAERTLKFLLWQRGAWKVHVGGPREIGEYLSAVYSESGARLFDFRYMSNLFERAFTVVPCAPEEVPSPNETGTELGRHLDGCRVGFDLGASDRKSCAVRDGEVIYSEEVRWDPARQTDPEYHYREIMDAIRSAASRLPRLDAVGGSAAGVYIDNRVRAASLFRSVPAALFEKKVAGLFLRIREELGVPLEVINDGEVTALAGSMSLGSNPVLGIAMGSSEAAGYVDAAGRLTGWLDELAFVPIDYRRGAPVDEWSGDEGCGVQYLSQVGAIRVAEGAGMTFAAGSSLPEKLVQLQDRMKAQDPLARQVYQTLGTYLGYALAHYAEFYDLVHVLVLGRVTTGAGGEIIVTEAERVLRRDFPELAARVTVALPDESGRRVGQAIAAASLPELERTKK